MEKVLLPRARCLISGMNRYLLPNLMHANRELFLGSCHADGKLCRNLP